MEDNKEEKIEEKLDPSIINGDSSIFHTKTIEENEEIQIEPEIQEQNELKDESVSETLQEETQQEEIQQEEVTIVEQQETVKNETNQKNNAIKKYIFYISKDFVNLVDSLSIDERTAFINDAIQLKIDSQNKSDYNRKIHTIIVQAIIVFVITCIFTPIAIFIMNKAIMITFDNYRYSQHNFEKLYKQRFESDRAYMRSVQYNERKRMEQKRKKTN